MGQQASKAIPSDGHGRYALPPQYVPLCDTMKAGDPASAVAASTEEIKDALGKILEFNHLLRYLPKASEVSGSIPMLSAEQQVKEIVSSVDSVDELFQYISNLAAMPLNTSAGSGCSKESGATPGLFDARIAGYVRNLQALYQLTKREKYRYEQRLSATRSQATSQRMVVPPPLPLPTQNCMTMGWDLVVHLLKATRRENPQHYLRALDMIKENLLSLKPTTYSDSMYLSPSASSAFNMLSDCLGELAFPLSDAPLETEAKLGSSTIETLAEVGLVRGSLATLLFVVLSLMKQPDESPVNISITLSKLAALKEQPMYGKCEASGELYSCGQNSYGELGIGDDIERHLLSSVPLCGWDDIRQVVSGNETLAIVTNDGVVLTCGLNKSGQCGQGHFDERVMLLRPVQALRSQRVKFLAASNGCEHMIALTETGLAYSWGYNDRGQLGHENLTTKIHIPKLIESLKDKKLAFAAVSYHHSAVVTDTGELYTFGMNDCGQLGLDHTQHQSTPQLVKALEGHEVTMISCGLYHTMICTSIGELFSCGKNDYGQLGLGHSRLVKSPTLVSLPNEMICFIASGYYHSIAVSTTGRTFAFGRNDYGQLGIGTKIHQNVPSVVALSASTRMIRATCGCYHTVLLSEQGQVYVFGRNNKGQLGNRGSADSLLPVPLKVRPEKNSRRCIDIAAGFYTTSLIVERKRENEDGDLVILDQSYIVSVCGRVDIDRSGEIEGLSNFGSISTIGVSLFHGKWFYEVEVVTSGLIQIGWIDGYFQGSSDQGEGVGDHTHSWSYDGNRQRRWNSGSSSYGEKWKAGDVIGCLLDLNACEMTFFRNGINLGTAYSDIKCSISDKKSGMMPGISLERGEIIRVNLGHQPFAFPPTVVGGFDTISRAIIPSASTAVLKSFKDIATTAPPPLHGSASVLAKNKLFVIGGSIVSDGSIHTDIEASNHVWVFHLDSKRWDRWSDFPIGIRHHQVVAIDDDHILVIGGENKVPTSRHMDLYKCSTLKNTDGSLPAWELVQGTIGAATSLPVARAYHTSSAVRVRLDTMVFMYGGKSAEGEVLGDAWYLSLEDYTWSRLPTALSLDPGARLGCSSAVIGESVFVFGGQDKEEKFRADIWRYNTFDRLWHISHDDNISTHADSIVKGALSSASGEFFPVMPEPRIDYSMCSDLGHVWIYGGINQSGQLLSDLWCYSITSQKWSAITISSDEPLQGCCLATLFVENGAATALASSSDNAQLEGIQLYLYGGQLSNNGVNAFSNQLRCIIATESTRTYGVEVAKNVTTVGRSAQMLNILRSKSGNASGKGSQQCVPDALNSAICLLSHLDRLAGNDIPGEDSESVQLSRCSYRSLCIEPKEKTFSALYYLIQNVAEKLVSTNGQVSHGDSILQILYPLLVTIRLLKLNFFELSRCCLDVEEIGFSEKSIAPGGILHSIREMLFNVADRCSKASPQGELLWFYHALKQETASCIYYGFPTLFPSLLDRLDVMNKLMKDSMVNQTLSSAAKQLLIPMLVPCFTTPKMLFQLMSDSNTRFESKEKTAIAISIIVGFTDTLLDKTWAQTTDIFGSCGSIDDTCSVQKKMEMLENNAEFKCLNVVVRAAIFWCSSLPQEGWQIIEPVCLKLISITNSLIDRASAIPGNQIQSLPSLIQHSFPGKLLPFILVSTLSLPAVRELFPSILKDFWPQVEALSSRVHTVLDVLKPQNAKHEDPELPRVHSFTMNMDFVGSQLANVSSQLSVILDLSTEESIQYEVILKALWSKVINGKGFKSVKIKDCNNGFELHRVTIPVDLARVFGTETFLVRYRKDCVNAESSVFEYDSEKISLGENRTVLSQHIYPIAPTDALQSENVEAAVLPPPAPTTLSTCIDIFSDTCPDESRRWLEDFQNILAWVGSHFAATLIIGEEYPVDEDIRSRWASSLLFRGGLNATAVPIYSQDQAGKDQDQTSEHLLGQIVDNVGYGKKLLDKIRNILDPGSASCGTKPKLLATRLKRQDSVEAALEKSGGFEVVDRAVRAAFAALLKHSNTSYMGSPITTDGNPSEPVIDAWRSALQLRRWIVREQQKLAASSSGKSTNTITAEVSVKDRQQELYNTVCEPLIRRAQLLLQLVPAPLSDFAGSGHYPKLFPGYSASATYDLVKPATPEEDTSQMQNDFDSKTMEGIETEDEQVQSEIFLFLQQSRSIGNQSDEEKSTNLSDCMTALLQSHQNRARCRLDGLKIFFGILEHTETMATSRFHIVPVLASAFKRGFCQTSSEAEGTKTQSIGKVHFLEDLEYAGAESADAVRQMFFKLVGRLLKTTVDNLTQIKQLIYSSGPSTGAKTSPSSIQKFIQDVLLVLEVCCIPYKTEDWKYINQINFPSILTELTSWKSWKTSLSYEVLYDLGSELESNESYTILPASTGSKYAKIICSRKITIGTDLQNLTLTHRNLQSQVPGNRHLDLSGGLAVFDKILTRGRWYWEVSIRSQKDYPIFVGISSGSADLNLISQTNSHGIFLCLDSSSSDTLGPSCIRWHSSDVIGVLLNCEQQHIEFYSSSRRICSISLGTRDLFPNGYYPTIGLQDAEIFWDLAASVPSTLWASSVGFQFPTPMVSGGLMAVPFDGSRISLDAKSKGRHLQLTTNGSTVVAGDSTMIEDVFESIVCSKGFDRGLIYAEIHIISPGHNRRCQLSCGIVGSDFADFDACLPQHIEIDCNGLETIDDWGNFGALFDLEKGSVTTYANYKDPVSFNIDVSSIKKPFYPALSALCNGMIFSVNFHPHQRPDLPSAAFHVINHRFNSQIMSSNEIQIGKSLQFHVHSCDGGEFNNSHVPKNCLVDDPSVYSSTKRSNVNLILKHEVDTPFCVTYATIRGPGPGYSSPLKHAIIFVTSLMPDLEYFQEFDNFSPEEFAALPFPPGNLRCQRDERLPVAYFVLDGSCAQLSKQLASPVTGRYVLIKFISPSSGVNIDVGYIGLCGTFDTENGPAYNENTVFTYTCDECKCTRMSGLYYGLKDDDSVKLCAVCYDDNRGQVNSIYCAYDSISDAVGIDVNENGTLCQTRTVWQGKVGALLDITKKVKVPIATSYESSTVVTSQGGGTNRSLSSGFDDCELFSCGQNNYGELCLGHCNSTSKLEHVPLFSTKNVRDIAGGNEVLAVVMKDGSVFTCGLNKSGQCGNGTFDERVILATPVRSLSGIPIDMVAASNGCEHMIAVAADGSAYSWGYNDRGQLGLGSTISKSHTPRLIESLREKYNISFAAVSYHHSAVVTTTGELLTFGMNDCGQLGLDHTQHQHTPQLVDTLSSQVITKVACGLYHTVVVTAEGEVYSFGKNDYGQLGLGHARNVKVPSIVKVGTGESDEKIIEICCGYYHTIAITERGKLVNWGRNDYGQLGIGSKDHKNAPHYVPLPQSSKILKASCGCYHTLILLSNGRVMVFGRNNKGQLGTGARTLPSADLPLPIPSNSLLNDNVVCIAAGFYSSYILTGRSSQSIEHDALADGTSQEKDLTEHQSLINSDALYESLMKEIDRHNAIGSTSKKLPLQIKRNNAQQKIPLIKLQAAVWAMTRALMYQSLCECVPGTNASRADGSMNPVLRSLLDFLLENMNMLDKEAIKDFDSVIQATSGPVDTCISMQNARIGVIKYFWSKTLAGVVDATPDSMFPHLYRNQVLWVLLMCGSVSNDVCSIIAANSAVISHVVKGLKSSDLSSSTICVRLAMLILPLHSIESVNNIHRSILPSLPHAGNIISMLLILVGNPLILRPRLCSHELGVECYSSELCASQKCLKGILNTNDWNIVEHQMRILEKDYRASAKSTEIVALLRYLMLFPAWKKAVNTALRSGLNKVNKLGECLDTICSYYANVEQMHGSKTHILAPTCELDETLHESVRKPESTTSPEIDEGGTNDSNAGENKDSEVPTSVNERDKHALGVWKKAKDAIDTLSTILASVSILGGHTEIMREGAFVQVDDSEVGTGKTGILSGVKRENRSEIVATVSFGLTEATPFVESRSTASLVPVKNIQIVESVPAIIDMFDGVDEFIIALSSMILHLDDALASHSDLNHPQNSSVQVILRSRLKFFKKQIQWRSTKALASLLKQMSSLSSMLTSSDSRLVSNLAQLVALEGSFAKTEALSTVKSDLRNSTSVGILYKRWHSLKNRQMFLEAEEVIDSTLDCYETEVRKKVVHKLGTENALSWGIDAIQSPRKTTNFVSGSKVPTASAIRNDPRTAMTGFESGRPFAADLPFGVWGVLHPLPQLNEADTNTGSQPHPSIAFTPFHLTTSIVRVGRSADSCDLIVNDRSVSGRHFHIRRARRDHDGAHDYYELQDFSKNGTIVNGVRVHGASISISPGSRISLILSRGGLVTYEFQVRSGPSGSHGRLAPPPIIIAPQNPGDLNILIPGQEYQQPNGATLISLEPQSPAEIQNRGSRSHDGSENRSDSVRNRIAATQGLRLITSLAESDVPRALISPNPAVDSPRAGGFNSPRSSVLQTPGTPSIGSPTASMYNNSVSMGVMSPASYQQRDSFPFNDTSSIRPPENTVGGTLRIALGRESVNRESAQHRGNMTIDDLSKTRVINSSGDTTVATHTSTSTTRDQYGMNTLIYELHQRTREDMIVVSRDQCEEALRMSDGDIENAMTFIHEQAAGHKITPSHESYPRIVLHLAVTLGKSESVCAEALRQSQNNLGNAVRLLLSTTDPDLERLSEQNVYGNRSLGTKTIAFDECCMPSSGDSLVGFQEILEENPSFFLAESSGVRQVQRPVRPGIGGPKHKGSDNKSEFAQNDAAMWNECNNVVDDRLRHMNLHEVEQEEEILCQLLTMVHSRMILSQLIRLLSNQGQSENPLVAFGDRLPLRQLISFVEPKQMLTKPTVPQQQMDGKAQHILSRMASNVAATAASQTMSANIRSTQILATQSLHIDQVNHDSIFTSPSLSSLIQIILNAENYGSDEGDRRDDSKQTLIQEVMYDTMMHILSRTFVTAPSALDWDASSAKSWKLDVSLPKGPINLFCGLEALVVTTYDRVWSIPSPDPLLKYRHKWRKRSSQSMELQECWMKSASDHPVTIWRPAISPCLKMFSSKSWFNLGDVVKSGNDIPDTPVLFVHDDGSGLLLPPIGFERVDVTGKGLPRNSDSDEDFLRKQLRSLWWPIAPPGYVAIGCIAGSKEDPLEPPPLSSVRCVREDLVTRVDSFQCLWRAEAKTSGTAQSVEGEDQLLYLAKNQFDTGIAEDEDVVVQTSLWSVNSNLCGAIIPVITLNDVEMAEPSTAFGLNLSDDDKIICSPVSVNNILSFVHVLLECQKFALTSRSHGDNQELRILGQELPSAIFALIKKVLSEKLPLSSQLAVELVRALIFVIQNGWQWKDKNGLIYCRSKIMTLNQDQEGGLMLSPLFQAFIELMLVVDEQNRQDRVDELTACQEKESAISLPYRFHFTRELNTEMLVSHSSKMTVTRHFSGEERKFVLEYRGEESNPTGTQSEPIMSDFYSCRFEHTPELVMTMKDQVKAEIIYYEVTMLEWNSTSSNASIIFGFSPVEFALEGNPVGSSNNGTRTYSFSPVNGKVLSSDTGADAWRWNEIVTAISSGDIFGCGLRIDTQEIFFTKNGQLLGTAYSSVRLPRALHPTISFNSDCKLLTNFGSTTSTEMRSTKVNFSFRFNSMDCENLMSSFEWYEHLSQVFSVMKALMDPARNCQHGGPVTTVTLPDEFMLSADNFLSEISEDVCIRVESSHPYDLELREALVSIPLATSIRLKLDHQCETANAHCLQILQGGENTETSESEVRAYTGCCGGQEVMIEGDSFVWRFPVQSNFQCRVDRIRKGPYLKLEQRDTRLSLSRDKGWQTAIGVARFDSGIHIWEVRISFVTASSNIFLGIARKDVRLDSYLGKDNRGWGWIGNRALWHNGSKQRGTYGEKFKTGDIVKMTLDLKRGTLSYALNGKDLGVAFGPGGTGPKLEGTFYPGFALYNQRDSIDLIGGHRVEDGSPDAINEPGSGHLIAGEETYYSDEEDDGIGEIGEGIPNFRMELATTLSQMGFPIEWCVYALRHCEDDAEAAADFILANMHAIESLVRDEIEAYSRRARRREHLTETTSAGLGGEYVDEDGVNPTCDDDPFGVGVDGSIPLGASQGIDKWGIAFTAVPEFSPTGRRLLALKYSDKLKSLHDSQAIFTSDHDHALVQIVNDICEARAEALLSCDPLRMAPEEFVPSDDALRKFPCLNGITLSQLQTRFLILRSFNCRLQNSLSYIDFSIDNEHSLLAKGVRQLRGIMFQHVKLAWWLSILKEQQSPAAARPEIEVDRHRARDATETTGVRESVFAQTFDQLHSIQPSLLRGADRAFKCQFVGEFGDDFGGLYRECIAQMSSELQSNILPVLKPCPNAFNAVGENREVFVPNVHFRSNPRFVQMSEFVGKLMGIAIRTKTPLDLNLPSVVWKMLVHDTVTRKDIESIHQGCFQVVDTINNITVHGITDSIFDEIIDASFSVMSSAREEVELVPGGKQMRVTWDDKDAYAQAVELYRLTEFKPVCDDIARGIATILPAPTLALFTWKEFLTLVCGKPTVDIDLLKRRTIYGDGCLATDPHIAYFWEVLGEFTDEQKSSFLRFVWGRSRLPTHAADFTQDFKISGLPKAAGRADMYLPIAHTCFFSIDLPTYSCQEVMREKLLYAITHCQSIDADNTTVAQRAGQGLNWSTTVAAATATAAAAVSSIVAGISSMGES